MTETSAVYQTLPACAVCGHAAEAHNSIPTEAHGSAPCSLPCCGCPGYQRPLNRTGDDPTERVLADVGAVRQRQVDQLGYDAAHDDGHTHADWRKLMQSQLLQPIHGPVTREAFERQRYIQVAALAVAAVEALDRQHPEARG